MAAKEKRKLKDLNLLDKFLFDEAMEERCWGNDRLYDSHSLFDYFLLYHHECFDPE